MEKKEKGYRGREPVRFSYIEVEYDRIAVGRRIREFRDNLGMSRYELAEEIGCSFGTLGRIERGERDLKSDQLLRLSECFGVPVDDILKGDRTEGCISDELIGLFKKTTYVQQCAVIELARAFHVGE